MITAMYRIPRKLRACVMLGKRRNSRSVTLHPFVTLYVFVISKIRCFSDRSEWHRVQLPSCRSLPFQQSLTGLQLPLISAHQSGTDRTPLPHLNGMSRSFLLQPPCLLSCCPSPCSSSLYLLIVPCQHTNVFGG